MGDFEEFCAFDKAHNDQFKEHKINYKPCMVLSVTVLRCRNISVDYISDKFDIPDPQFYICCPKLKYAQKFRTRAKDDQPTCDINETFNFAIPFGEDFNTKFPVEIELYDSDLVFDDYLGKQEVDVSGFKVDKLYNKTISFQHHGEVDVSFIKQMRSDPEFRLSLALCDEEMVFRQKRIPKVKEGVNKLIGKENGPKNLMETPIVSVVCSGGGYRAAVGMCGGTEALVESGLNDIVSYFCGLSGSSWYLSGAYALEGVKSDQIMDFHIGLRDRFKDSMYSCLVNPTFLGNYEKYLDVKKKYRQPHTFVDMFGYAVGTKVLGEGHIKIKTSDLQGYVKGAEVPFPLFASIHVRDSITAPKYHSYVEVNPFEIQYPSYGIGMKPQHWGAAWNNGVLARNMEEQPLHFLQGMLGCAFAIIFTRLMEKKDFIDAPEYYDQTRLDKTNYSAEIESDASDDEEEEKKAEKMEVVQEKKDEKEEEKKDISLFERVKSFFGVHKKEEGVGKETEEIDDQQKSHFSFLREKIGDLSLFTSRNAIVGRTARILNIASGLHDLKTYTLNPFLENKKHSEDELALMNAVVVENAKDISTTKGIIAMADAGLVVNVPVGVAIRPQRNVDMVIVLDFNGYSSDSDFNWKPLISAAAQAWNNGLKFPTVNYEKMRKVPPTDYLVFEEEGCPTVVWITLCNKAFKALENFKNVYGSKPPSNNPDEVFNDFPVFNSDAYPYKTYNFAYTNWQFDRLRALMKYNVMSHIEEIKAEVVKVVQRKRKQNV